MSVDDAVTPVKGSSADTSADTSAGSSSLTSYEWPPTIAWRTHTSPALSWPAPPPNVQELMLLMIDWDAPTHEQWSALNSAHVRPLSPSASERVERAPFVLWLSALMSPLDAEARSLKGLPEGYGGRGWPLRGRAAGYHAQGDTTAQEELGGVSAGYTALNGYSHWFTGRLLRGPYGGYGGPCVSAHDPKAHRVSALLFGLARAPQFPSSDQPPLSALELLSRTASDVVALSRADWRATLPHDPLSHQPLSHEPSPKDTAVSPLELDQGARHVVVP